MLGIGLFIPHPQQPILASSREVETLTWVRVRVRAGIRYQVFYQCCLRCAIVDVMIDAMVDVDVVRLKKNMPVSVSVRIRTRVPG